MRRARPAGRIGQPVRVAAADRDEPAATQHLVLATAAAVLAASGIVFPGPESLGFVLAMWLLPAALGLVAVLRVRSAAVPCVLALAFVVGLGAGVAQRVGMPHPSLHQVHDGGVVATDHAADLARHGDNPYGADFAAELERRSVQPGGEVDPLAVDNPLASHYPYLPGAFLVDAVPLTVAHALGVGWDVRWLYFAMVAVVVLAVARSGWHPGVRTAMLLTLVNPMVAYYLLWGSNDAAVGALLVGSVLLSGRRQGTADGWAAVLLALAISFKVVVGVMAVPILVAVHARHGWAGLRRWWPMAAVLAATIAPYFLAHPGDFIDDTVRFNLGGTPERFPTSGIGLPARLPGVFNGPVLTVSVVVLATLALVVPAWVVARRPTMPVVALAASAAFVVALAGARTFQVNYLLMPMMVSAVAWIAFHGDPHSPFTRDRWVGRASVAGDDEPAGPDRLESWRPH